MGISDAVPNAPITADAPRPPAPRCGGCGKLVPRRVDEVWSIVCAKWMRACGECIQGLWPVAGTFFVNGVPVPLDCNLTSLRLVSRGLARWHEFNLGPAGSFQAIVLDDSCSPHPDVDIDEVRVRNDAQGTDGVLDGVAELCRARELRVERNDTQLVAWSAKAYADIPRLSVTRIDDDGRPGGPWWRVRFSSSIHRDADELEQPSRFVVPLVRDHLDQYAAQAEKP